jgi:CubicO group peptidase (beta-lactamase class C family)
VARAGALESHDVQTRDLPAERSRQGSGIFGVDGYGVVAALVQAHDLAAEEIERGHYAHAGAKVPSRRCSHQSRRLASVRLRLASLPLLATLTACVPAARAPADRAAERTVRGTLSFRDPERRAKLARAFPEIDRLVRAEVDGHALAGMAFGVVLDGELAHFVGAGYADLEAKRAPEPDTVYRIASITKSFTALAVLALRDDGRLRLDDPLVRYVPEAEQLVMPTRDSPAITIREVLNHTSGLPNGGHFGGGVVSADAIAASLEGDALEAAPGMRFSYSNFGYQLLGVVVERVTGEPLRAFLARRLFAPLGLRETSFDTTGLRPWQLAVAYDRDDAGVEHVVPNASYGAAEAAGGIFTSVRDMAKVLALHLGAYPPRDDRDDGPIRRSTVREAHLDALRVGPMSVHTREPREKGEPPIEVLEDRYAFGLAVHETCELEDFVTHNGGLPGWSASIGFLPRHGVGLIAFTNQGRRGRDPTDLLHAVVHALAKTGGLVPREARPVATRALELAMQRLLDVYTTWDPTRYHAMLSLDRGAVTEDQERRELAGYKALHGACASFSVAGAHGARDARFALQCERGSLEMEVGVDKAGLVTSFSGTSRGIAPPQAVTDVAGRVLGLLDRWDDAVYSATIATGTHAADAFRFDELRRSYSECALGIDMRRGDDHELGVGCKRGGGLRLELTLPEGASRATRFALHEVRPGGRCR